MEGPQPGPSPQSHSAEPQALHKLSSARRLPRLPFCDLGDGNHSCVQRASSLHHCRTKAGAHPEHQGPFLLLKLRERTSAMSAGYRKGTGRVCSLRGTPHPLTSRYGSSWGNRYLTTSFSPPWSGVRHLPQCELHEEGTPPALFQQLTRGLAHTRCSISIGGLQVSSYIDTTGSCPVYAFIWRTHSGDPFLSRGGFLTPTAHTRPRKDEAGRCHGTASLVPAEGHCPPRHGEDVRGFLSQTENVAIL